MMLRPPACALFARRRLPSAVWPPRLTVRSSSSSAAAANPLLALADDPLALPDFAAIQPAHVEPAVDALVARLEADVAAIVNGSVASGRAPAWDDVLALEAARDPLERAWAAVGHLNGVAQSEALRAAYSAALPKVVAVTNRLKQDPDLYRLHTRVLAALGAPGAGATPGQLRTLQWAVKHAELAGVALPAAERAAVTDVLLQLSARSQAFDNHVLDSTAAYALTLTRAEDVDGLPSSVRSQYAAAAARAGAAGATTDGGPWRVTLDLPSFRPFMTHATRRDLREQLYRAHITRASADGPGGGSLDNAPLVADILALRARQAALLGFPDYAHLSLATKMAPSLAAVTGMMADLRSRAFPAAQRELAQLGAFAAAHPHLGGGSSGASGAPPPPLAQWDVPFWSERMLEAQFGVNEEELRRYLPLPAVLDGMWATLRDVFGVAVERAPVGAAVAGAAAAPSVWHEHASFWHVRDADAAGGAGAAPPMASFYLDPYSRLGVKRGGAWADVAVGRTTNPGLLAGRRSGGGARNPVAFLVCNQPAPVDGGGGAGAPPAASLMRHSDVLTLWHEVGHGLQHMLTAVPEGDVAGLAGVEWDAVELPSQMNEELAFHPAVLKCSSRHVDTGQPLPDGLIAKLRGARRHMAANALLRQLYFSVTDLALHTAGGGGYGGGASDAFAVQRAVAAAGHAVLPPLHEDRFLCAFTHIFSGGYAAGYYSYKWAEVLAADAWAAFEEAGLGDAADAAALTRPAVAAVGRRYRATVLGLGGSVHPGAVFRAFRGRDPSVEPLLRSSGLA